MIQKDRTEKLARARVAWCEHGWSYYAFHFWAFCLMLTGYQQILCSFDGPFAFLGVMMIAVTGFFAFKHSPRLFFLWSVFGACGFFVQVSSVSDLFPLLAFVWCLVSLFPYRLEKDRLLQKALFFIRWQGWMLFRMSLGLALTLQWLVQIPEVWTLTLLWKGTLALGLLSGGWLRWTYHDQWMIMEKGLVFLTILFMALSWQSQEALSLASLVALVGAWDLRIWPARRLMSPHQEVIFFDGDCSLCEGAVSLILIEDHRSTPFFFASQSSPLFESTLKSHGRTQRADALYVLTAIGELFEGERAVSYILGSLGGLWFLLAVCLDRLPSSWVRSGYQFVAKARKRNGTNPSCARTRWPEPFCHRLKTDDGI